ncbi:MAG: HNH endonuclease, partial [bacterium]
CPACNWHKARKTHGEDSITGKMVPLFNPRYQIWSEHFAWSKNGVRIVGKTPVGRATIAALKLNDDLAIAARRLWVAAGKFPPSDS